MVAHNRQDWIGFVQYVIGAFYGCTALTTVYLERVSRTIQNGVGLAQRLKQDTKKDIKKED